MERKILGEISQLAGPLYAVNLLEPEYLTRFYALLDPSLIKLRRLNLIADENVFNRSLKIFYASVFLTVLAGVPKLILGIMNNKPVLFLIGFLVVAIYLLFKYLYPKRNGTTALGRKFIKRSQIRFEYLLQKIGTKKEEYSISPYKFQYVASVFGIGLLLDNAETGLMQNVLAQPAWYYSTGFWQPFGYGRGSGCSGGSACSGGCSGGSGCSGGCGGCGGD